MPDEKYRIFPLGDSALTVEFGTVISRKLNERALALSAFFENDPFPGFVESVPAYASTTIFYDLVEVRRNFPRFPTGFEAVKSIASDATKAAVVNSSHETRHIEIPVDFGKDAALDLTLIAGMHEMPARQVIEIFTATTYSVFMLGFLPGFAYMGEVDDRIATPRKDAPRLTVPKGSVGIAGKQAGVYSLDSPGGWQIIGRTDQPLFDAKAENPSLLRPGDRVRFVPVK